MEPVFFRGSLTRVCALTSLLACCFVALAFAGSAAAAGKTPITIDLGGQTLTPGVYNSASSIGLTGVLTLDGRGNSNSVFVFQAGSTLTTATASQVKLINGAKSCNVFWQVGSSATLGTGSTIRGTILALTSITVTTGVTVDGRVLARNGAVTLDSNTITKPGCAVTPIPLGTADSFGVLAGSAITNTGPTTIDGDIGTFPTPTITGTATMTVKGTNHGGDATTQEAKNHLVTAYDKAVAYDNDAADAYTASQAPAPAPTPPPSQPTLNPGDTFGATSCAQLSGINFIQSGFCFYFPDMSTNTSALCDVAFCGSTGFLLPSAGTFTASLTYPSASGFSLIALQLCHDTQTVPDAATCSQTMSPGGAGVTCSPVVTTDDNGTPLDTSDDIDTFTISCPIAVGDSVNPYTLIVYPLSVLHCDLFAIGCLPDITQGLTAALSGSFSGAITPPGPSNGKVTGGGQVAPQQHFSIHAVSDSTKWSNTHLRFGISTRDATRCKFVAQGADFVDIQPNQFPASASVSGSGTVTDSLGIKHAGVRYTLNVTDGGKGGTDTFQLSAPGCDTHGLPVPVTHGNIKVMPH
jgi:hypothetical protein